MLNRRELLGAGAAVASTAAVGTRVAMAAASTIAVLPKTVIGDVFMNNFATFAKAKGSQLGANVEIFGASSHTAVEEQVATIETLIARKVNAIVLAALDSKGLAPAVNRATKAGIPVILADSGVQGADYVTVIQTDNIRASGLAADYAACLLSYKGKVAQLEGEPGSETAQLRTKGFHDKVATYKELELVSSITGHWSTPGGVEATEAILHAHPDVNLIFASSDLMAVGSATVLERAARKDIIVVGFDGITEGTDLILKGQAAGDVAQNAKAMGEISVQIAMDLISGAKKPSDYPKAIDSGMMLVHPWNVDSYRETFLGIKKT